jgi:hypothetical protein
MPDAIQAFIDRWSPSGGAEQANYALFLSELCDILGVPHPEPTRPDDEDNAYVFERRVVFQNPDGTQSYGRIDLYKRGCFVLETKQGIEKQDEAELLSSAGQQRQQRRRRGHGTRGSSAWNDTLLRARGQAEQYARALTAPETRPPFLVVVDVGHTIDLYSEFTQTGGTYIHFPDATSHRIKLADLANPEVRDRLRAVWLDPLSLDPSRRSAKVTREIAAKLAELARLFEGQKHDPHDVAQFLMRCLFTMFAEDVGLLPKDGFKKMLKGLDDPAQFRPMAEDLWRNMNVGGFSAHFRKKLLQFNGGLFADPSALDINRDQLDLLIEAAEKQWKDVEPAIFGTLLERALDPVERHKLGAHYTPRAYVERLVMPTIVEPIRAEWDNVRAAAILHASEGNRDEAVKELEAFHDKLCETKVLDPACGSGNFLYVTLEHLKRIEGEVFSTYQSIAERQTLLESGHTVDPHQLLGIEINPRAAAIADIVLWIGYLQWHFRTRGNVSPPEPVIKNFKNIECRDALLTWSSREPLLDEKGKPVTHWDGRTTKKHPVTGEEVPDETAREISYKYNNPKKAEWPEADYVVGNPPFIGDKMMKQALGEGYVKAVRDTYDELGGSNDFVLYWWHNSANLVRANTLKRFGLIATNSLRQNYNRRVISPHLSADPPISITFAIPDHPWVDSSDGAAVRISMTVGELGRHAGSLLVVVHEPDDESPITYSEQKGQIKADLTLGADVASAEELEANALISCPGVKLFGQGFVLDQVGAESIGLGRNKALDRYIRPYLTAREIAQTPKSRFAMDFLGLQAEEIKTKFPAAYQRLVTHVKPERDHNNRDSYRKYWWLFGEPRKKFREALVGLQRQIVTPETSKHRFFQFLPIETIAEGTLVVVADDDAFRFGILSSRLHESWAIATGSRLGVGNDYRYNKTRCFDTYPFPAASESQKSRIRELGEQLDAHRKRQQAQHPKLTMTGMYNVLEKLRADQPLTAKEQEIHEQGLVSVLRQIHDDLDAAVADAYGWPADLADEEILARLVALNHERAEEERRGIIRYLRPDFQNPTGQKEIPLPLREGQGEGSETPTKTKKAKPTKQPWPKTLSDQAGAVHAALTTLPAGASAEDLSKLFGRKNVTRTLRIEEILQTLAALGKARQLDNNRYVAM